MVYLQNRKQKNEILMHSKMLAERTIAVLNRGVVLLHKNSLNKAAANNEPKILTACNFINIPCGEGALANTADTKQDCEDKLAHKKKKKLLEATAYQF